MNYDILCFMQHKIIDYYLTLVQCISATCIFMMGARLQSINHGGKWLNVGCSWAYGGWGLLSKGKCEIVDSGKTQHTRSNGWKHPILYLHVGKK
jgi:hypothetical protein